MHWRDNELLAHVARHLSFLAFSSLPADEGRECVESDNDGSWGGASQASRESIGSLNEEEELRAEILSPDIDPFYNIVETPDDHWKRCSERNAKPLRISEPPNEALLMSFCNNHQQFAELTKQGRYAEAESFGRVAWEGRRRLVGAHHEGTLATMKNYLDILLRNGKWDVVERECADLIATLPDDAEHVEVRNEAMSRIGEICAREWRYAEASLWLHRALPLQARLDVESAAATAAQILSFPHGLGSHGCPTSDLEVIWANTMPHHKSKNVLLCGRELGDRLLALGRDKEAVCILSRVWEGWKSVRLDIEAMATTSSLIDASIKTDDLSCLESVYDWIVKSPALHQTYEDGYWALYRLGCVQAIQEIDGAQENIEASLDPPTGLFWNMGPSGHAPVHSGSRRGVPAGREDSGSRA